MLNLDYKSEKLTLIAIGIVLAADVLLLMLFLRWAYVEHWHITSSALYGHMRFSSVDGSLMESWGYVKEICIIGLAAFAFRKTKDFFYAAYSVLFLSVLADDALRLHEHIGTWLSQPELLGTWGDIPAAFIVSGMPLALAVFGFFKMANGKKRPAFMLLAGFGAMAFFAVVVDNLHSLLIGSGHFQTASSLIEDGGELLCLTLILAIWRAFLPSIIPAMTTVRHHAGAVARR